MNKIKIITDTCSDITEKMMADYDIDYVRMNTVLRGVTKEAELNWTKEDAHSFYQLIRSGERITTTQVPVEEFENKFTYYLEQNYDIIYIACSSKQSGSVNTAAVVGEKLMKKYQNCKIKAIDSLNSSTSLGMLAIEASKLVKENNSFEEIVEKVIKMRKQVNEFCTVHSLEYLRRAGRVKGSAAFFGNLMGVKPIIIADADGNQSAFKKVKGRQNSMREIVSLLKEAIINPESQTVYFSHADCSEEEVDYMVELIKKEIPCKDVCVGYIGPIIGASVGPDALAVFAFGKEVTYKVL